MSNLIIAAHPDDEILGCAGLIKKQRKRGIDSYVLILTDGAGNRYTEEKRLSLRKSALEANKKAGTKGVFFEDLPNQELDAIPLTKIIRVIEKYLNKVMPDIVFTHHGGDLNKDHRLVFEATITAIRPIINQRVKKVFSYHVASSTEWNLIEGENSFVPNTFVDIKKEIEAKIEAMKCYKSEIKKYPHPRSPQAIKAYANYWGLIAGMEYAEPLRLIRDISATL